jgi:hypothetical protein
MPISIHLDHLHNVFIAAGTLACAVIIVVITVRYAFFLGPSIMHNFQLLRNLYSPMERRILSVDWFTNSGFSIGGTPSLCNGGYYM